jgi:hypothetical protein
MSIGSTLKFMQSWNDTKAIDRLRSSDKSSEVQAAAAENSLKDMSLRFQYGPTQSTMNLWAKDIINAGYQDWMVSEVCKSIPFKFEKMPNLSQIMELLRTYLPQASATESELDKYTNLCYPHLKNKFVSMVGQDALDVICGHYINLVGANYECNSNWTGSTIEKAVLGDWLRCYFKPTPQAIIDQGRISNQKETDLNYFLIPLKRYAEENKLT